MGFAWGLLCFQFASDFDKPFLASQQYMSSAQRSLTGEDFCVREAPVASESFAACFRDTRLKINSKCRYQSIRAAFVIYNPDCSHKFYKRGQDSKLRPSSTKRDCSRERTWEVTRRSRYNLFSNGDTNSVSSTALMNQIPTDASDSLVAEATHNTQMLDKSKERDQRREK
ncbi:MAG: hypothetical protein Q9202_001834 [Teloschistes flavicans]